ncbi:hypothetical protein FCR2A7T_29920 [Flavobacterium cauense R2A-7]|nr:hypothetical protein FCR2A7T_29920 [Flavobacterium cauense R2A-7]
MKSIISLLLILFSFLAKAQEIETSEESILQKAELYNNAWQNLDASSLPKEERIKIEHEEISIEYCAERANYYYTELVNNFPSSKNYLSYLFNKGSLAADIRKSDDAIKSLTKVIEIVESEKLNKFNTIPVTDLCYYQKLSFYYLVRVYESDGNCLNAKYYVAKLEKLKSDKLNEYENWDINETIKRINRNCSN